MYNSAWNGKKKKNHFRQTDRQTDHDKDFTFASNCQFSESFLTVLGLARQFWPFYIRHSLDKIRNNPGSGGQNPGFAAPWWLHCLLSCRAMLCFAVSPSSFKTLVFLCACLPSFNRWGAECLCLDFSLASRLRYSSERSKMCVQIPWGLDSRSMTSRSLPYHFSTLLVRLGCFCTFSEA